MVVRKGGTNMKKVITLLLTLTGVFTLGACSGGKVTPTNTFSIPAQASESEDEDNTAVNEEQDSTVTYIPVSVDYNG